MRLEKCVQCVCCSFFKRWMNALLWKHMIYLCLCCTTCNNRRQVYPRQQKWDKSTLPLSLAGFRASSWTDLLPPPHWCQMNDERQDMKTIRHFITLFFLFSMTSQHSGQEHNVQRGVWFNCVPICQISQMFLWPSSSCMLAKLQPLSFLSDDFMR